MLNVPLHKCLACGAPNDAVTQFDPDDRTRPRAGDISLCQTCGHLAVFMADDLGLREMSAKEREEVLRDPRLATALKISRDFLERRKRDGYD